MALEQKEISQQEYEALDLNKLDSESAKRFRIMRRNNLHIDDNVKIAYGASGEHKIIGITEKGYLKLDGFAVYFHPMQLVRCRMKG